LPERFYLIFFSHKSSVWLKPLAACHTWRPPSCTRSPERLLYSQPNGPNPLNHLDDFSGPALRHGSLNSHFPGSLLSTFIEPPSSYSAPCLPAVEFFPVVSCPHTRLRPVVSCPHTRLRNRVCAAPGRVPSFCVRRFSV